MSFCACCLFFYWSGITSRATSALGHRNVKRHSISGPVLTFSVSQRFFGKTAGDVFL